MIKATFKKHSLIFKKAAGTSRGVLLTKDSYFLILEKENKRGIGECSILPKLSLEKDTDLQPVFQSICTEINLGKEYLMEKWNLYPAVKFCIEMAFGDLNFGEEKQFFDTDFYSGKRGIVTNGLIWMGDKNNMSHQIEEKLKQGFSCVKLKIGAINWQEEIDLLKSIRENFSEKELELRVDANGAFKIQNASEKLEELAKLSIHSIEQPIMAGQWEEMKKLCAISPIKIALDEELISIRDTKGREKMLQEINPAYIIIKPSLVGGFKDSDEWIKLAEKNNIKWWATSALESNIGLNAIAQWTSSKKTSMPQGLGTGSLFTNNITSPLEIKGEKLYYSSKKWEL